MARSCPKLSPLLLAWALPVLAAAPAAAPPALDFSGLPIFVDAASSEVDAKTNAIVFHKVVISQGSTRVQADQAHATGLTFANSRWTFEGNVQIDAEQRGNLHSDQAIVEFKDNHIARAIVTGKPAEFEQKRADSPQIARGHADQIVYDVNDGTVRLSDDAWLSEGQREISAPILVYNIREQRFQATTSPGTDQRVHIKLDTAKPADPVKAAPKQPATTSESQPHP